MSHKIEKIDHHIAGDSVIFGPWTVKIDGEQKNIENDELKWYLFEEEYNSDPEEAILSHNDDSVEVREPEDGSKADGEWEVFVSQGITEDLGGYTYWQRPIVDPSGDSKLSWKGEVVIEN